MATRDILSIPLDDEAFSVVAKVVNDELSCDFDFRQVFFFGQLVNEDDWCMESPIDESKFYAICPTCHELIEFDDEPLDGQDFVCPHCDSSGALFDFHDPDSAVNEYYIERFAFLEKLDKGYVLRLFDVGLDYSDRDYGDYLKLEAYPLMTIAEVAREYWYEGKVKYYVNKEGVYKDPAFKATHTVDDGWYRVVNYFNDFDDEGYEYGLIDEIIYNSYCNTFMEFLSRKCSYQVFNVLNKYGFDQLTYDMIYVPHIFGDSKKISEVLKLDFNQVIAAMAVNEIGARDILAMRELKELGLKISYKNVFIFRALSENMPQELKSSNLKKIFKYLRNQMSRSNSRDIVKDYSDYLSDCRKLGLDTDSTDIRYPTDLQKAHIRTTTLLKIEVNREMDERIQAVYERCHELCEFSNGVFCVVMPSCSEQIIAEGKIQSHCVGNYCERMANGEDIILFLRKVSEPDKPFYTMEIRPSMKKLNVVQCRGYKNEDKDKQTRVMVDDFLSQYTSWFNHRKCDVKLGKRKKYYKAVCKTSDGRYISHWDNKTEYRVGEIIETRTDLNPDRVAVPGIHIASLEFAKKYGDAWNNAAILEIEVDMCDVVIPDAKDQIRAKRGKVLREVPMSELGDWGARHIKAGAA